MFARGNDPILTGCGPRDLRLDSSSQIRPMEQDVGIPQNFHREDGYPTMSHQETSSLHYRAATDVRLSLTQFKPRPTCEKPLPEPPSQNIPRSHCQSMYTADEIPLQQASRAVDVWRAIRVWIELRPKMPLRGCHTHSSTLLLPNHYTHLQPSREKPDSSQSTLKVMALSDAAS